jgi:hypothetical protein
VTSGPKRSLRPLRAALDVLTQRKRLCTSPCPSCNGEGGSWDTGNVQKFKNRRWVTPMRGTSRSGPCALTTPPIPRSGPATSTSAPDPASRRPRPWVNPLGREVQKPAATQVPTTTASARPSATSSHSRSAPTCGSRTKSDSRRRNRGAWRADGCGCLLLRASAYARWVRVPKLTVSPAQEKFCQTARRRLLDSTTMLSLPS